MFTMYLFSTGSVLGERLVFVDPYHKQIYQVSSSSAASSNDTEQVHAVAPPSHLPAHPISVDYVLATGKMYWIDQGHLQIRESVIDTEVEDRILLNFTRGE